MSFLVVLAGLGQITLAAASLAVPGLLQWREKTRALDPLTRAVFWVYACYILGTNVAFGLISCFAPSWLLDGSPLARAVGGFIALYWGARIAIQFAVFHKHVPEGARFRVAEAAMLLLFACLTILYGAVALGSR